MLEPTCYRFPATSLLAALRSLATRSDATSITTVTYAETLAIFGLLIMSIVNALAKRSNRRLDEGLKSLIQAMNAPAAEEAPHGDDPE